MVTKCANPACSATFRYCLAEQRAEVIPIDRVTAITRLDVMGSPHSHSRKSRVYLGIGGVGRLRHRRSALGSLSRRGGCVTL